MRFGFILTKCPQNASERLPPQYEQIKFGDNIGAT